MASQIVPLVPSASPARRASMVIAGAVVGAAALLALTAGPVRAEAPVAGPDAVALADYGQGEARFETMPGQPRMKPAARQVLPDVATAKPASNWLAQGVAWVGGLFSAPKAPGHAGVGDVQASAGRVQAQ